MKQVSYGKPGLRHRKGSSGAREENGWMRLLRGMRRLLLTVATLGFLGGLLHLTVFQGDPSSVLWFPNDQYEATDAAIRERVTTLKKATGEPFRMLVFSDIQLGLNPIANTRAMRMMDELVEQTDPHFIMTTGDNGSFVHASPLIAPLIHRFESYDIPWGIVFGNHDGEGIASRNWLGLQYEKADNSVFNRGPSNIHGVGNYVVSVENDAGTRICSLVMLDTNARRAYADGKGYDILYPDQIAWYSDTIHRLDADGSGAPHLLFFHIPLPEMATASAPWLGNNNPASEAGNTAADGKTAADGMTAADGKTAADGLTAADGMTGGRWHDRSSGC